MSDRADLLTVVDRTALIENILSQVIEAYCRPRDDRSAFFWTVVLDSSVIPFGAKVKVAMAVANELKFKIDSNPLHTVISLRNAFAHQATDAHPVYVAGKTRDEDRLELQLQILSGAGKITQKRREDALQEFNTAFAAAKSSLVSLLEAVKGADAA